MKSEKNSKRLCPLCGKEHDSCIVGREATTLIKGEEITYQEFVLVCNESEEEADSYVTASLSNKNLLAARDAYRVQHRLLTSKEIAALRKSYGLTQAELAQVLGWGEVTVTRYETKAIQDEAHDALLRIVRDNPMELSRFLERNKNILSPERFSAVQKCIVEKMESSGSSYLRSQAVQSAYLAYREPSALNGFRLFDEQRFAAAVSYLAGRVQHLYKTRLMKMLWYADSLAYRDQGHAITGLVYSHMPMGALPIAHNELMELGTVSTREEERVDGSVQYLVEPNDAIQIEVLSEAERAILDKVIDRFKYSDAASIVATMHNERAYMETDPGQIISFEFAREITL